jgi:hypothetical protein
MQTPEGKEQARRTSGNRVLGEEAAARSLSRSCLARPLHLVVNAESSMAQSSEETLDFILKEGEGSEQMKSDFGF